MSFKAVTISNGGGTTGFDPIPVVPATAVEGDRMTVVVQTTDNNPSIAPTPPATETWTLEASASMPVDGTAAVSPSAVWIYGKDVSADDEANAGTKTYTWTFGGAEEQCAALFLTDPAEFGEFAKNELTGNRTTIDAPSVTTTVADELAFHCALKDGGVAFTGFPSGDATVADEVFGATNGAGAAMGIVREEYATPGATGVKAFTHASFPSNGYTFSLRPVATEGISSVTPAEFDFDDASIDVAGLNFGASQGSGAVYLSDETTLAGGANEVDISAAIQSWSDTLINLDLTALGSTEIDALQALGPAIDNLIVVTNAANEYGRTVTTHRIVAFVLAASANITAGGENTTARLTPPSGKTTGDFGGGRIQDDENPGDTVDLGADQYREDEWCIQATAGSVATEDYEFEVLIDGQPVDVTTVTPTLTIESPGGSIAATISSALSIAADLEATGALTGEIASALSVAADLTSDGQLEAALSVLLSISAGLAASGDLQASVSIQSAVVAGLSAGGDLAASIASQLSVAAELTASGSVAAAVSTITSVAADLQNASNASIDASIQLAVSTIGDLVGLGEVEAAIALALSISADLQASGQMAAAASVVSSVAADLAAAGALSAPLSLAVTVSAGLTALGRVDAAIATVLSITPDLSFIGDGGMNSAIASAFSIAADLQASGELAASPALVFTISPALTAEGALSASMNTGFSVTADGRLIGNAEASVPTVSSLSGDLTSPGQLSSVIATSVSVSSTLLARGGLLALLVTQSSLVGAILDGSAVSIPNIIQTIVVALSNAVQSLAVVSETNSSQSFIGGTNFEGSIDG